MSFVVVIVVIIFYYIQVASQSNKWIDRGHCRYSFFSSLSSYPFSLSLSLSPLSLIIIHNFPLSAFSYIRYFVDLLVSCRFELLFPQISCISSYYIHSLDISACLLASPRPRLTRGIPLPSHHCTTPTYLHTYISIPTSHLRRLLYTTYISDRQCNGTASSPLQPTVPITIYLFAVDVNHECRLEKRFQNYSRYEWELNSVVPLSYNRTDISPPSPWPLYFPEAFSSRFHKPSSFGSPFNRPSISGFCCDHYFTKREGKIGDDVWAYE